MQRAYRQGLSVSVVVVAAAVALWRVNSLPGRDESRVARGDYLVVMETDFGNITLRLFTGKAPSTVDSFVRLARDKFYNGLTFHQVDTSRGVIVGGMPPPEQNPDWTIPYEESGLEFERGRLAMFHPEGDMEQIKCAFLIALSDHRGWSQFYTVFGQVVEGMDVVDRIGAVETTGAEGMPPFVPKEPIIIHKVAVSEVG
jgi:peptidyl-prolyl cis-trans isomerase B (cyclophilin B)